MTKKLIVHYFLLDYFIKNDKSKYLEIINAIKEIKFNFFIHFTLDMYDIPEANFGYKFVKGNAQNYEDLISCVKKELELYDIDVQKENFINFLFAKYLARCSHFYQYSDTLNEYLNITLFNYIKKIKDNVYEDILISNYPKIFFHENGFEIKVNELTEIEEMNSITLELNTEALSRVDEKGNLIINKPARNEIEECLYLIEELSADNDLILKTLKDLRRILK